MKTAGYQFLVLGFLFFLFSCKQKETKGDVFPSLEVHIPIEVGTLKYQNVASLQGIDLTKRYPIEIRKNTKFFFEGDNVALIKNFKLDKDGVVIQPDSSYFPTEIAQMGLRAVNHYRKTGSEESKVILMNQAKWAKENFTDLGDYGFWMFSQPQPLYHIEMPWTSGMGQGEMISLCLGAYEVTQDNEFLIIIEKALKGFLVPLEDGGFLRNWDKDEVWFEEYATSRPSRVLNGFIFALGGVYQVYEASGSDLAFQIFNAGIHTLRNHLSKYDAGYTSRYNLADWKNEVAKEHYHEIHIIQLLWLYRITGDPYFKKYAQIFLENDRGDFANGIDGLHLNPKIKAITASNCIDCENYGPNNLNDVIWAYGNYWSSYKDSELVIDFGEIKENFYALTLYHVNRVSSEVNFDLYAFNENESNWELKQRFFSKEIKDKITGYNLTSKFETYIEHYKIFESIKTSKIKLVFHTDINNIIAIRELNFMYNRGREIDYLLLSIDKRLNDIYH